MKVHVHDFKFSELIFVSLSLKTWKSTQEVHWNLLYFLISNIHFQAVARVNHPQPRKKISFLISTGKAEEVSCTIISNSVKSPVGHRQYKKKKFQISLSTILGQSNASYQFSWQQIRTSNQFFSQISHSFQLKWWSWDSEMEMKTMKCLNLLLRMFVSMVSPDNILAMPLISLVFIVVNEGQCQRSNPILPFHNPVYTTHNCVPACM